MTINMLNVSEMQCSLHCPFCVESRMHSHTQSCSNIRFMCGRKASKFWRFPFCAVYLLERKCLARLAKPSPPSVCKTHARDLETGSVMQQYNTSTMAARQKYRYAYVVCAFLEVLLFGGLLFGWASLVFVLKEDGVFSHLCPQVTTLTTTGAPWNESSTVQPVINDTWNREFSDLHSWWTLLYNYYIHSGLI